MLRGMFAQAAPYLERLQAMFSAPGSEGGAALQMEDVDDSVRVDWLALQAMLLSAQGKPHETLAHMLRREQIGAVQPGFVKNILAAFAMPRLPAGDGDEQAAPPSVPGEPTPLITPLTDRELDVLRLIAQGLKYAEIAERLYISINTVRFHVKAIYGKLYVNNRTQALDRARQLQLF
jgi:DNA-binding CsgD family transcriptional regulator